MKLLRDEPYKVQTVGGNPLKQARLLLPKMLLDAKMFSVGEKVFFHVEDGKIVISTRRTLDALAEDWVRQYGTFIGVYVPMVIRRIHGLDCGARYLAYVDENHQLAVEVVEAKE